MSRVRIEPTVENANAKKTATLYIIYTRRVFSGGWRIHSSDKFSRIKLLLSWLQHESILGGMPVLGVLFVFFFIQKFFYKNLAKKASPSPVRANFDLITYLHVRACVCVCTHYIILELRYSIVIEQTLCAHRAAFAHTIYAVFCRSSTKTTLAFTRRFNNPIISQV